MQLSQKETDLLKDLEGQEKLCVDKYAKHAEEDRGCFRGLIDSQANR